jgi:YD repeat-containing protein
MIQSTRYLAIEAEGMDYNPNYLIVEFEQGGKSYTLTYDDFSLSLGNLRVMRLPDSMEPGPLKVTVTNRGGNRLSQPASIVAEITSQRH